jgi:hypothetical protein
VPSLQEAGHPGGTGARAGDVPRPARAAPFDLAARRAYAAGMARAGSGIAASPHVASAALDDHQSGAVAVAERVRAGHAIQFQLRDATASREDLEA